MKTYKIKKNSDGSVGLLYQSSGHEIEEVCHIVPPTVRITEGGIRGTIDQTMERTTCNGHCKCFTIFKTPGGEGERTVFRCLQMPTSQLYDVVEQFPGQVRSELEIVK